MGSESGGEGPASGGYIDKTLVYQDATATRNSYAPFSTLRLEEPMENNILKIIDFGLSCKFAERAYLTTKAPSVEMWVM